MASESTTEGVGEYVEFVENLKLNLISPDKIPYFGSKERTLGIGKCVDHSEAEQREIRHIRNIEIAKYVIVSLAFGIAFGGAACVLWMEYFENGDGNPAQHFKCNSYFGGMIRLVKGSQPARANSTTWNRNGTIEVLMGAPGWLNYIIDSIIALFNSCWQYIVDLIYKQQSRGSDSLIQEQVSSSS